MQVKSQDGQYNLLNKLKIFKEIEYLQTYNIEEIIAQYSRKRRLLDIRNDIREDCSEVDEESDLDTEDFSLNSFNTENTMSHDVKIQYIFDIPVRKRIN